MTGSGFSSVQPRSPSGFASAGALTGRLYGRPLALSVGRYPFYASFFLFPGVGRAAYSIDTNAARGPLNIRVYYHWVLEALE